MATCSFSGQLARTANPSFTTGPPFTGTCRQYANAPHIFLLGKNPEDIRSQLVALTLRRKSRFPRLRRSRQARFFFCSSAVLLLPQTRLLLFAEPIFVHPPRAAERFGHSLLPRRKRVRNHEHNCRYNPEQYNPILPLLIRRPAAIQFLLPLPMRRPPRRSRLIPQIHVRIYSPIHPVLANPTCPLPPEDIVRRRDGTEPRVRVLRCEVRRFVGVVYAHEVKVPSFDISLRRVPRQVEYLMRRRVLARGIRISVRVCVAAATTRTRARTRLCPCLQRARKRSPRCRCK